MKRMHAGFTKFATHGIFKPAAIAQPERPRS